MSRLTQIKRSLKDAEERPNGVQFYLFGSILQGSIESDIDLLCVYDPAALPPGEAYIKLQPLFVNLQLRFGSPVHPVVLSKAEEIQVKFIDTEDCVSADL